MIGGLKLENLNLLYNKLYYDNNEKSQSITKTIFKNEHFDVVVSYTVHLCTEMALHISAEKHYVFFHSEEARLAGTA